MFETKECSWSDFLAEVSQPTDDQSTPLFRGARKAKWKLSTTLERVGRNNESLNRYYRSISIAKRALECCSGQKWDIPENLTGKDLEPDILFTGFYFLPACEYMVYLRHHGFPSPILDWSQSPYVASFFAFSDANIDDEYCAIYRYIEFGREGKGGLSKLNDPRILSIGPSIATHKRHFMQQSEYTFCVKQTQQGLTFSPHEEALQLPHRDGDNIVKYILPISERQDVLRKLRKMNISAYTLFGNEDALIHTLAHDEYVLSVESD